VIYLDSSAIVKLVVREDESAALRRFLREHPVRVSCALARVEVPRAVAGEGTAAADRARQVLGTLKLLSLDEALLDAAGTLPGQTLRSLDAIHLAAARELGPELHALVTYDRRMADAGAAMGLPVAAPGKTPSAS
jgi:predicted nucleic acid-binding protein